MSSRSFPQSAVVMADKKRQKREARIRESYDRISAALINTDSTKFAARHPTRAIPDVPGLSELQKTEIKKDFRAIEKHTEFMYYPLFDDDEALQKQIPTSTYPVNHEGSNIMAKMKRMLTWKDSVELRTKEMKEWRDKATQAKVDFERNEEEHAAWITSFENSRKLLIELIEFVQNGNRSLQYGVKQMLQQLITETSSTTTDSSSSATKKNDDAHNMTIREMVLELDRREKEACTKANTLAKDTASKRVLHLPQAAAPHASNAQKIVKVKSEPMIVEGEDEPKDNDDGNSEVEQLIKLLEDAHEAVLRSEALEGDVEFLFQQQDSHKIDHLQLDENSVSNVNDNNGHAQTTTALNITEQVLLHSSTVKAESEQQTATDADVIYKSLLHQPTKKVHDIINQLFESVDTATIARTNNTTNSRRRRHGAEPAINLVTCARSRTERKQMLLFSPLSQFEDRYLGTLPHETLFHPVGVTPGQYAHILPQVISDEHMKAENNEIERYSLHSEAVHTQLEIEKLTQSVAELQRLLAESDGSYHKTQTMYQQVLHEDAAEHARMMQYLSEQGLLGGELHANESFITTAAAAEILEAKPYAAPPVVAASMNSGAKKSSASTAAPKEKKAPASRSNSINAAAESAAGSTAKSATSGKKTVAATSVAAAAVTVKAADESNSSGSGVGVGAGIFASAAAAIGNALGVNVTGNKRKSEASEATQTTATEVTTGSASGGSVAPAAKRRK